MKFKSKHIYISAVLILAAICLVQWRRIEAQPAAAAKPTRVGVCDIVKVFSDYKKGKDLSKDLQKKRTEVEAENARRIEKLEQLKTDLELYKEGSPQFEKVFKSYQRGVIEREVWLKMEQESILRKHARLTREMFAEIKKAIAAVAKQKGLDMIIQLEVGELLGNSSAELFQQINRQQVLFSTPSMEITGAVIQKLNESYIVNN